MSYPVPGNEAKRLKALHAFQILDSLPQKMFDDITALAAGICGTPMALITLVDAERQWFKSRRGVELSETPRDESFCAHTIMDSDHVLAVRDAAQDPRFSELSLVVDGNLRFYAGAPIVTGDGLALGAVCVLDTEPRTISPELQRQLQRLADLTMGLIEHEARRRRESQAMLGLVRRNERVIRSVIDEGRELCSFIDPQHRFLYVNPAYETHWVQPREQLIGMHVEELLGPELYRDSVKAGINQALAGHDAPLELVIDFPGVGKRHLELRYLPAHDEDGRIFGVVERCRDVTDLVLQAKQLRQHVAELQRRRVLQDKYLHAISHDLKEPVNAITNATPLLVEKIGGNLSPIAARCLKYIEQAGRRLDSLLEDMRTFGEVETGGELSKSVRPAFILVHTSLAHMKDLVERYEVSFTVQVDGDLVVNEAAFDLGLRSAIAHLLRTSSSTTALIDIKLDIADGMSRLAVVDQGGSTPLPRIESDDMKDEAQMDKVTESSLLLWTARQIAMAHGGWLQEESPLEGGRSLIFMLPRRLVHDV